MEAFDLGTLYFIASKRSEGLTRFARLLTDLGDVAALVAVGLIGTGLFVLLNRRRLAAVFALTALGSWGVSESTKYLVARPRPTVVEHLVALPTNLSFPSGHALCSMAIYGCLGLLLARVLPRKVGWLPPALGILLSLAIGMTRPYLGVHYPTDVLGGWIAGLGCALIGSALAEPAEKPQPPAP
jgi:undecaprenyl-diphosphatase